MGRRKTNFEESLRTNSATYIQYLRKLVELSASSFDWQNLPDTIDARHLELTLFRNGNAIFFEDEVMGYLGLQCTMNGGFDVYDVPIKRRAYAINGYQRELNKEDSVVIYNNYIRTNSYLDMLNFAKRLYNLDRIIDVNSNAQKTPILIKCDENERLTMLNAYKEYDGNAPVIYGSKGLNSEAFTVLQTGAPYVADRIYELKTNIWNEALTYLGISNISMTKKERMVTDEVKRNMGGVLANRNSRVGARQQACEQINKMFGLDIWCEFKEGYFEDSEDGVSVDRESGVNANADNKNEE